MWSDERERRLRSMWREGYSSSRIASAIGEGLTRNAVIGKIYRLGLKRGLPSKITGANGAARSEAEPHLLARARRSDAGAAAKPRMPRLLPRMAAPVMVFEEPSPNHDGAPGVGLLDLNNETCRWPLGDPLSSSFRFCGALEADLIEGRPYCPACAKRAFVPRQTPTKKALAR